MQLPLKKGDAAFFNPALFHAAGHNRTRDVRRLANLLQISSAYGRAMELVDRVKMAKALYPSLAAGRSLDAAARANVIAACAEGYAFPTNLDRDPPIGGLAPQTQAQLMAKSLAEGWRGGVRTGARRACGAAADVSADLSSSLFARPRAVTTSARESRKIAILASPVIPEPASRLRRKRSICSACDCGDAEIVGRVAVDDEIAGKTVGPRFVIEERPAHPRPVATLVERAQSGVIPGPCKKVFELASRIDAGMNEQQPARARMRAEAARANWPRTAAAPARNLARHRSGSASASASRQNSATTRSPPFLIQVVSASSAASRGVAGSNAMRIIVS